jgi:pimeloyl-ACP methyl ester carboxylesterase
MGAMMAEKQYDDRYWQSPDGLRLHYRDYPGGGDRPPILCIPGLTRNARDFAALAERLSPDWRVLCVDLRGRGSSDYAKDSAHYTPETYAADLEALIAELGFVRCVFIGTSLGGLVSMMLTAAHLGRVAAVVLNDIGPVIEAVGLERIKGFVGRNLSWPTWVHAARALAESNTDVYPEYSLADWIEMAKRLYRLTGGGRIVPDYDLNIATLVKQPSAPVDLWPLYAALAEVPTLILRGAHSDILSAATAQAMIERRKCATLVTVANVGHTPTLGEPAAVAAIDALLASVKA